MAAFTLSDALAITPVADPAWNDDGTRIGYLRTVEGETRWATLSTPECETTAVSLGDGTYDPDAESDVTDVSAFVWRPGHPEEALVVADGDLYRVDATTGATEPFARAPDAHSVPTWHPDGDRVAYRRDGAVWVHGLDGSVGPVTDVVVPDIFAFGTPLEWDPSGRYLATLVAPGETLGVAVLDTRTDDVAWQAVPDRDDCLRGAFAWVGEGHLVYAEDSRDGTERVYRSVRVGEDEGLGVAVASESVDGLLLPHDPVGHESGRLAVVSARTGWRHVYAIDVDERRATVDRTDDRPGLSGTGVVQVTEEEFEARGDASDVPSFAPDGERLAYVTNEADPGERHLEVATLGDGAVTDRVTFSDIGGNAAGSSWSPDGAHVAFLRGGQRSPVDVHVAAVDDGTVRRVSVSHPDPDVFDSLPVPERVTFESTDDTTIDGYLYLPPDRAPDERVPSVVYCHGGPIAQMRNGFSARPGHVHAYDQVLAASGYAVLELNFRSGIGRGRPFEQAIHRHVGTVEVADCEAAATYLRERPETSDRVGMWGISYGGFLANALATMSDEYDCAVNVAGIWDWRTWCQWAIDHGVTHWGIGEETWFYNRFGGRPDSDDPVVQERYRVGSPNSFVENLDTPLLALHGMDDRNVPIEETNDLLQQAVEVGAPVSVMYYPDEQHGFSTPATWTDAAGRMEQFFEDHLQA
ncbi:S9 family peptidase [Halomarina oriensis]|nr:prolyl oligopeptidase family serine peptidase [Halomarina oriensis]